MLRDCLNEIRHDPYALGMLGAWGLAMLLILIAVLMLP